MTIDTSQRPPGGAATFQRPRFGRRLPLAHLNRTGSGGVFVPVLEGLRDAWNAYYKGKQHLNQVRARANMYGGPQT